MTHRLATIHVAFVLLAGQVCPSTAVAAEWSDPPITGIAPKELKPFDDLLTSFMAERKVPGAALAVVKDGRLVLARGYGWADREAKEPVRPGSLFRIASLSKPITAAAVLHLAQSGKLPLEAKIFDVLELQRHAGPKDEVDPRLKQVTVRQLLQHTAGFDREKSFDPMFRSVQIAKQFGAPPPAGPADIVRYMTTRPLDFTPGERYAYSNFGYCLLGRAIEKVSGRGYEDYVREAVLKPLGMRRTRLGKTLRDARVEGEVTYYADGRQKPAVIGKVGQDVPLPYGAWYLEAMDAHGGWISSVVELARFAAAFDQPRHCPILSPESLASMLARPPGLARHEADGKPKDAYYACGWMVRPVGSAGKANHWHTGSLDGTATLMVRRHDGLCWVVLFNTRSGPDGKHLGQAIDVPLHAAADAVKTWPAVDLFQRPEFQ
jgi:N-acyl-D-amino-acid deacylase